MPTERLTEIFLELVRIDAVSRRERPVAEHIRQFLSALGFEVREDGSREQTGSDTGNLLCAIEGGGETLLLAHMDTVAPTTELTPVFEDGVFRSDGTTILGADNRAGVAAILYAVERARREGVPIRPVTLGFTVCEEVGLDGSRHLELDPGLEMAFVFDSSSPPGNFVKRGFGAQRFEIRITGKAAHAGLAPERGVSAILAAGDALAGLELGRLDAETTANVGTIEGGSGVNVVPERVALAGEVRAAHEERVEEVVGRIGERFEAAARARGASCEISTHWDFRPYRHEPETAVYERAVRALEAVGLEPRPTVSAGGSDANSLNARGLPAINFGNGVRNPHGTDEAIAVADLEATAAVVFHLLTA